MFDLLIDNRVAIYCASAASSLIFALVILSLLHSERFKPARRWATPFADTFLVLAVNYCSRLIYYYYFPAHVPEPFSYANAFVQLCSGVTNYLFILSAYRLTEPSIKQRWAGPITKWLVGRPYVKSPLLWALCGIGLLGLKGNNWLVGDDVTSIIALLLMGFALYRYRIASDKIMAWVAMISSIAYALLYVIRLPFDSIVQHTFPGEVAIAGVIYDALVSMISLILKFGFFFAAYSLILWMSGPLHDINQFFERATREEKEYLESEGLVRSICEWIATKNVRLYVKLPGGNGKQLAVFHYPPSRTEQQQPQIIHYVKDTTYDHVMTRASTYRKARRNNSQFMFEATSIIAVPVFFHNCVIACLEAEISGKQSRKDARIVLERLAKLETTANLISPAVQTYREMSALNKLSHDLAQRQIDVVTYDLRRDINDIAETTSDVVSPSWVALSVEIGFSSWRGIYPKDDVTQERVTECLDVDGSDEDILSPDKKYRLLRTKLEITSSQRKNDQVLGRLVLGIENGLATNRQPTIGTNPTCRRAVSDQVSDTLLDFVRGYLNQLTDQLGVQLSGLKGTVAEWHHEVDGTARDAGLLWAVVKYSDDEELIGDRENLKVVADIESPTQRHLWEKKSTPQSEDEPELIEIWLYSLRKPVNGTSSVIKLWLKDSNASLWVGVGRPGFGPELDYVSPWKYFLLNFGKIADSALGRVLIMEERNKLMSELQDVVTRTMTTGIVGHQLKNLALDLKYTAEGLNGLIGDKQRAKDLIAQLSASLESNNELRQFLEDFAPDKSSVCIVNLAIQRASQLVDNSLKKHEIHLNTDDIPPNAEVKIPFRVLSNTIAIVFDNAKDAINQAGIQNGSIKIRVTLADDQKMFNCDISDNGPGVPAEIRKLLFKAPVKSKNHGVGLYFSAYVLKLHGAEIMLLPEETHPETTFRIQVPR